MRRRLATFVAITAGVTLPGSASAMAAGAQSIALVIQLGEGPGSIIDLCIEEPAGTTGAQALADGLRAAGLGAPSYSASGLLCSINGTPTTGCGVRSSSGYQYWAYFHGSASGWAYAADGPGTHLAMPASVEGWRFESAGTGRPGDPAPVVSPDPAAVCAAAAKRATRTTTTTQAPATAPLATPTASSEERPSISTTTSVPTTTRPEATKMPVRKASEAGRRRGDGSPSLATSPSSTSSPWGALGGVAVLAVLCGAGLLVWRKRSA